MRKSGLLMHISSLPSPYGIGSFGREAYDFVDFLKKSGQSYWQILPLGCTGYGDSPYQSFSTFAGNPYFIDLDMLRDDGLLEQGEYTAVNWGADSRFVNYGALYENRLAILRRAHSRFNDDNADFRYFCEREAFWLYDFALFMALKSLHSDAPWHSWEAAYQQRQTAALSDLESQHAADVSFWLFVQYKFFQQWFWLKDYANQNGIQIIGDLPIYVADDSADTWANPTLFDLDDNGRPNFVAGVPPDAFSADGQLWGNPLYNWDEMAAHDYRWWVERLRMAFSVYDLTRLDHFRGFESYYALPHDAPNAVHGVWKDGPGIEFFQVIREQLGDVKIIAENLGYLTPAVRVLHEETGFPGMNVLHFAFGADDYQNENLPHNIHPHTIAYAGTHDNDTTAGWLSSLSARDKDYCLDYMNLDDEQDFVWHFIKLVLSTSANLAVLTMQDCLGLGSEARMNRPATLTDNWHWRAQPGDFSDDLARRIAHITHLYGRSPC